MMYGSTPLTGANIMDVVAMDSKLLIIVISASLLLVKNRRKRMANRPVTHKVLLKDGTPGQAVRLTARNNVTVRNWIPGVEYREQVAKGGQISNQRIMVPIEGTKATRAAYYDDWVVKTEKGFQVVKFDKSEIALFFIIKDAPESLTKQAFKRWANSLDK